MTFDRLAQTLILLVALAVATLPATSEMLRVPATAGSGASAVSLVPGAPQRLVAMAPAGTLGELADPRSVLRFDSGRASGAPLLAGNISYADPALGPDYLAVRAPVGTVVTICAKTCETLRSTDYGPSSRIRPARIADLALGRWLRVCGVTAATGLCRGTVTFGAVAGPIPTPRPLPTAPSSDALAPTDAISEETHP